MPAAASITLVNPSNPFSATERRSIAAVSGAGSIARDMPALADQRPEQHCVVSEIGSDIDRRHARAHMTGDVHRQTHFPIAVEQQMRAQPLVARIDIQLVPPEDAAQRLVAAEIDRLRAGAAQRFERAFRAAGEFLDIEPVEPAARGKRQ